MGQLNWPSGSESGILRRMKTHRELFQPLAFGLGMLVVGLIFAVSAKGETAAETDSVLPILAATETEALIQKAGQKVTVVGKCERTGKSRGGTNFVNFVDGDFTLVTFKSDLGPFTDGEPADLYKGKHLSVTGVIEIYKDAPQIKLIDPEQVTASDEPFEMPSADNEEKADETAAAEAAKKAEMDAKAAADASAKKDGQPAADEKGKPKPPVDPRKYFKKPPPAK